MNKREIKFRAWDGLHMDYDGVVVYAGKSWDSLHDWADGRILMQYTGLKDKNGKEIYERDIMEAHAKEDGQEFIMGGVVEWLNDGWVVTWGDVVHPSRWRFPMDDDLSWALLNDTPAVIGNTCEHPHLVSAGKDE